MRWIVALMLLMNAEGNALAQDNRIDVQLPDAPELAAPGPFHIGVRTLDIVHRDQPDVLAGADARYDRPLQLEIWYPAELEGQAPGGDYLNVHLANSTQTVTLHGQAVRDAMPLQPEAPYPLVILSHGLAAFSSAVNSGCSGTC